ncbi:hypothetical protein [Mesorhizobium sp. IMUNJ 23232]|uniref:hypothetical protein n=1 Tax=Mesorhizobium sp. IMUNJ 23232 TaxID=3376064 RepID=UPI00379A4979
MLAISLPNGVDGASRAFLRPLTGADELGLHGDSYRDAVLLVERLIVDEDECLQPGQTRRLPVGDFDAIIATLFCDLYGERAEARCECARCRKAYEFDVPVAAVNADRRQADERIFVRDGVRVARLAEGTMLRLPEVRDLLSVAVSPLSLETFIVERGGDAPDIVENALALFCPLLADTVATTCPNCGGGQSVEFDLTTFFMKSLLRERDVLLREIDVVARAYGWSFADIVAMPRALRHGFVRIAGAATARRARAA